MRALTIQVLGCIRYLRPDRNPLRRPLDRLHSRLVAVLGALFLITGVIASALMIHFVAGAGVRAEHRQAQSRYQVDAVVTATGAAASRNGVEQETRLRWRDRTGHWHSGGIVPAGDDRVGAHRRVWINQAGELTARPRTHAQTLTDTTLAVFAALTSLAILHAGAYAAVNRRLERRRMALWEAAWTATAPRWTGRA
ncbi:Rv1733c family protein [Actinoallomurus soli]|uniref:Rv1733c family protein n=1 Tax=Actinoallomurus soli TaxID=2952535 RepID=UPI002093F7CB|nr:hypothetical protein [Actinoallomurus soli]MCO5974987.1 hypothetical protein [Actinoallomurus soli]